LGEVAELEEGVQALGEQVEGEGEEGGVEGEAE